MDEELDLQHKQITDQIIGAAIEVHRATGPGLLESVYEQCLCHELTVRGVEWKRKVAVPVRYKGILLECGFRADLVVTDSVVVELKAVEDTLPVHEAQLLTYMKLLGKSVGLLLNFNSPVLKEGITRRVL